MAVSSDRRTSTGWWIARSALLMALGLLVVTPLWAQESRRGDRVIHRYLDPGRWLESAQPEGSGTSAAPAGADRPAPAEGEPPGLWMSPGQDEWIWTAEGPIGPQGVEEPHGPLDLNTGGTDLDDRTDRVDALNYQASFDPSVVPFKRGVVQNKIRRHNDGRYTAWLEQGSFQRVHIGGGPRAGEDRFWGSFLVRIESGSRHSIPSVAPDQRVLTVETEPAVELILERDSGDNFYVSADHDGLLRINMEIMVRRDYFAAPLDNSVDWGAFGSPGANLDGEIRRAAGEVLNMIGISRASASPVEALEGLVEYYRDFEARPFPDGINGDRYIEISRQKIGVCRHRSLTFMITAEALGIATRYVYNEAHAFVEIYWPGQGWRRIDLGGAADAFNYQNQQGGRIYEGGWDDGLPRPPAYEEELARLGGEGDTEDESGEGAGEFSEGGLESRESLEGLPDDFDEAPWSMDEEQDLSEAPEIERQPGPQIQLLEADGEVFRGQPLRVRGRVEPAIPGDDIVLFLVPSGTNEGQSGVELGVATVDEEGLFEGEWTVPRDVGLGRWRLRGRVK